MDYKYDNLYLDILFNDEGLLLVEVLRLVEVVLVFCEVWEYFVVLFVVVFLFEVCFFIVFFVKWYKVFFMYILVLSFRCWD